MVVSQKSPAQYLGPHLSLRWYRVLKPWHRLLMNGYFDIHMHGREHLQSGRASVLAVKHVSKWDPLAIALLQPDPLYYIARDEEFQGVQGWFMTRLGAFPVGRDSAQAATVKALESVLLAQKTLAIFPEGKLVPQGVGEIKPGLGRMVTRFEAKYNCSIPVIPVAIAYKPAPGWRARVSISVRPPLYAAELCHSASLARDAKGISRQKAVARELTAEIAVALQAAMAEPPSEPPSD
ncbi:MAG: lysophospholipid acyltransferase family protein [Cyanobacteria bacterium P01_F01_bin.33]